MSYFLTGLLLFFGVHSLCMLAGEFPFRWKSNYGKASFKFFYSIFSLLGSVLIIFGFGLARESPIILWQFPEEFRYVSAMGMLVSSVLFSAAYVPNNAVKAYFHHPLTLAIQTWALSHLVLTVSLVNAILFGSFLLWSVLLFAVLRRNDRLNRTPYPKGSLSGTILTVVVGACVWALLAFSLHGMLIGIRPLG